MTIDRQDRETALVEDDQMEIRVWLRLLTCSTLIEREVRARLARDFDITLPRFDVLAQLERAGSLTMGQLSRRMMVTHGNITGLVDRLVNDGLVDRRPVEGNRRANLVTLTQTGRTEFTRLAQAHHDWVCAMLADLDHDGLERLYGLLGRLKGAVLTELETSTEVAA